MLFIYTQNKIGDKTQPRRASQLIMSCELYELYALSDFLIQTMRPLLKPQIIWLLLKHTLATKLWLFYILCENIKPNIKS